VVVALHALDGEVELAGPGDRLRLVVVVGAVQVHVPVVELQDADVLHRRVAARVVLGDAGLHALPHALALGDVERVAEDDALHGGFGADGDVLSVLALRPALDAADGLLHLVGAHPLIVLLEEPPEHVGQRLGVPSSRLRGLGERRAAAGAAPAARTSEPRSTRRVSADRRLAPRAHTINVPFSEPGCAHLLVGSSSEVSRGGPGGRARGLRVARPGQPPSTAEQSDATGSRFVETHD
jgi:hypothetical protein